MPTTIDSAGITFNDATSLTSAVLAANSVGTTQITNGSVTAAKLGTTEQTRIAKAWVNFDGTTTSANLAGTYSQSGTTVTVTTSLAHNLSQGQGIFANITTGTGVDGSYTVATITSPTVFTYTAGTSLTTSGNITLNRSSIRSQYNVSSITKNEVGDYTVNFATAMADANYSSVFGSGAPSGFGDTGSYSFRVKDGVAPTSNSIRITNSGGSASIGDAAYGNVAIFGN
jgi:hypothetical protein